MRKLLCLLLALMSFGAFADSYDVTFKTLLEEMTDPAAHSKWNMPEYTCSQSSSYSRQSITPATAKEDGLFKPESGRDWGIGWFENHDFANFYKIDTINGAQEFVMHESDKPGCIVKIWMAFMWYSDGEGGLVKVYIDGEKTPVIEMDSKKMIGGNGFVGYPFSFYAPAKTENDTWRGNDMFLPIPYAKSCKISYVPYNKSVTPGATGLYYSINYRTYKEGTSIESFNNETMKKYAKDLYANAVKLTGVLSVQGDESAKSNVKMLSSGKSASIKLRGEKCITSISIKLNSSSNQDALSKSFLRISFDGETTVDCPVGKFFGIGPRQLANGTFYVKAMSDGMMTAYWVMPFNKSAVVTLVNECNDSVDVDLFQVTYKDSKWDSERSMYFHASWCESQKLDCSIKKDYNFVSIKGKGRFVADGLTIYNYYPDSSGGNWWGEGDEKIFVDGESFPSHFGTGTEDYYCYAYCRPQPFSFPFISQPIGDGNKNPGLSVNNRYRLLDDIPFEKSFDFFMEVWHPYGGDGAIMDYSPATFWYAFKGSEWSHNN